jgi:hypothetical protein
MSVTLAYVIARLMRERIHSEQLLVTLREANERLLPYVSTTSLCTP